MATVSKWIPFGVALDITATGSNVVRKSATQFTATINASWETYYSGAKTNYGMTASSGNGSKQLNASGNNSSGSSGSFTGTYSISGNGAATKTITVTFRNFNSDNGNSATKSVSFNVAVPAWTSYAIKYNANGGTGAPSSQTKWKDQTLTLSSAKPTRAGYSFQGWATSSTATTATYSAGGSYTANAAATLYAVWKANTYTVKYNANGGTGAPANQTKTYGKALTLSSAKPTRTNYNFKGWGTSASSTTVAYAAGASYTANAAVTLYAIWELAYVKPRITNLSIARCDSQGSDTDSGTYANVSLNWAVDATIQSILIEWESETGGSGSATQNQSTTNTSGSAAYIVGNGGLSTDSTYTFRITVVDSTDRSTVVATLSGTKFILDFLFGGNGIAAGKPAELEGVFDSGFQMKFSGGILHPVLEIDTDLNDVQTPNTYVGANTATYKYANCPIDTGTFTLEVVGCGTEGQLKQRLTECRKTDARAYERFYYQSSWGEWVCVSDFAGTLLWSGGHYMTAGHIATLSELVSEQKSGIVLVFSEFVSGTAQNSSFHCKFIPKKLISLHSGSAQCVQLATSNLAYFSTKYLYISDDKIVGHDNNNLTMTGACGITCTNNRFVLRYVIGV